MKDFELYGRQTSTKYESGGARLLEDLKSATSFADFEAAIVGNTPFVTSEGKVYSADEVIAVADDIHAERARLDALPVDCGVRERFNELFITQRVGDARDIQHLQEELQILDTMGATFTSSSGEALNLNTIVESIDLAKKGVLDTVTRSYGLRDKVKDLV